MYVVYAGTWTWPSAISTAIRTASADVSRATSPVNVDDECSAHGALSSMWAADEGIEKERSRIKFGNLCQGQMPCAAIETGRPYLGYACTLGTCAEVSSKPAQRARRRGDLSAMM